MIWLINFRRDFSWMKLITDLTPVNIMKSLNHGLESYQGKKCWVLANSLDLFEISSQTCSNNIPPLCSLPFHSAGRSKQLWILFFLGFAFGGKFKYIHGGWKHREFFVENRNSIRLIESNCWFSFTLFFSIVQHLTGSSSATDHFHWLNLWRKKK